MRRPVFAILFIVLLWPAIARAQEEARLLRFPTIHKDKVVFTYAGNLYTAPSKGGIARRLTSHDGFEMFARFSPDGKRIAFTGQYDGNTEVYIMPAEGGVPKRLTFTATLGRDDVGDRMGPNNIVMGWTPDGKNILFRSRMREHNSFIGQLFLVSKDGGLPKQLPLPRGGFASFSPDGTKLAYNQVFREFRTWKRYRGGMADEISVYDFKTKKTSKITDNPAQDIIPMWRGNTIYFLSDRGTKPTEQRFNLYGYDTVLKKTTQLTAFKEFDIKFPSIGEEAIVCENGGYLYRYDLKKHTLKKISIRILEDQVGSRTKLHSVGDEVGAYEISPDGKRALFSARGDLFTVPAKEGITRNLTGTPGVHDRNPKWSPDGKHIAYISDASGEDEIWTIPADGSGSAKQLTNNGDTYKYALFWSPDSKKILWADKKLRLQYIDVETKKVTLVNKAEAYEIREYVWSPDSKWVAFTRPETEGMDRVYLYSSKKDKSYPVTSEWFSSSDPAFSADGKYLFFSSARDFNPKYSSVEWNHYYGDMRRLYLVTLDKDTPSPFRPENDEVAVKGDDKKDKADDDKENGDDVDLTVDLKNIIERTLQLNVPVARNYTALTSVGDSLYYMRSSSKQPKATLCMFDMKKAKETELGAISGYEISADGKKMLVSKSGKYYIIGLPKSALKLSGALDLDDMEVTLDLRAEWKQIFNECWRQMRDFFYDPNMHGVDWPAMKKKYGALVKHVNHRNDLNYIIGEMIGELNAGHCYISGGAVPKVERIKQGLLGAQLERDPVTKYYKISKILKGVNWDKSLRSPLKELGVNINEGDYILAVDGKPVNEMVNIYQALVNTPGKQVRLKVNDVPKEKGSREVIVRPISDEHPLYYYDWVQGNIDKVNKATKGQVGYIHIPNMVGPGLNEFIKHFYPQIRKKGLIIDVRGNGGGNVSPQIIERLRRELAMMKVIRNTKSYPDPNAAMYGPMVCLMNEFSASDGDLFSYRFKHHKLGKTIGKRSWGGVIGIRGSLPLLDGGDLRKPEFATYGPDGKSWIIENIGVEPDIEVENDPGMEYMGVDQQLNRAIAVIQEQLENAPKLPGPPPYPKR